MVDAIVLFSAEPADMDELTDLALQTQPIFAKQPGFLGGRLYRAADGRRLVQHLQWRSMEDNMACMMSPDWQAEAGVKFMAFVQSGRATMEPQVYEQVADVAPTVGA